MNEAALDSGMNLESENRYEGNNVLSLPINYHIVQPYCYMNFMLLSY